MSSGFISEAEIAEQRRIRQEEWEKVRTADQSAEAPEEVYDPRCLYERLQEQKNKRDVEYEEAHKLKNMIKGLDDDEVEFLDLVDRTKMEEERKKNLEEQKEMRDFKAAVANLQEKSLDERLKHELKMPQLNHKTTTGRNSQLKLLAGVIKKSVKPKNSSPPQGAKRKLSETEDTDNTEKVDTETESKKLKDTETESKKLKDTETESKKTNSAEVKLSVNDTKYQTGALKCIGVLPGLGSYDDSSDSECSSDSEQEDDCKKAKLDLLGRKILLPEDKQAN